MPWRTSRSRLVHASELCRPGAIEPAWRSVLIAVRWPETVRPVLAGHRSSCH